MQTFLPYDDPIKTAKVLDDKRLGKQRLEAVQIARSLLGIKEGWKNHPAVKMWRGYEPYLIKVYLSAVLDEWERRGFKNTKCSEHWRELYNRVKHLPAQKPVWLNEQFCISHRSNLIRKKPEHYRRLWPKVGDNHPYIWPI